MHHPTETSRRNRRWYFFVDAKGLWNMFYYRYVHMQATTKKGNKGCFLKLLSFSLPRLWSSSPTIWKQNFRGGDGTEPGQDLRNVKGRSYASSPVLLRRYSTEENQFAQEAFRNGQSFYSGQSTRCWFATFSNTFWGFTTSGRAWVCQLRTHRFPHVLDTNVKRKKVKPPVHPDLSWSAIRL